MYIKAVSASVFDMINAVYHGKPLIFIEAVSDYVFDKMNVV